MTDLASFGLAQLAQVLSALENGRRNPNSKQTAIRAIARNCAEIGIGTDDVAAAAADLLDGSLRPAEWRAALCDAATGDTASDAAADDESASTLTTAVVEAEPAASETPAGGTATGSAKQQLLEACRAAAQWLQTEGDCRTPPDELLRQLRAAITRAEQARAVTGERTRRPRTDTKQARLIAMLQRGASISAMSRELGWLRHTCHGALAGLKKRGLSIVSVKPTGGERIYRTPATQTPATQTPATQTPATQTRDSDPAV